MSYREQKRVLKVKDAFISSLPESERRRALELMEYWEKALQDGGEEI